MTDYHEDTQTVSVPTHSGVEGFLAAIRQLLKLPKLMCRS